MRTSILPGNDGDESGGFHDAGTALLQGRVLDRGISPEFKTWKDESVQDSPVRAALQGLAPVAPGAALGQWAQPPGDRYRR